MTETHPEKPAFWHPVQTIFLTIAVYLTSQLVASLALLSVPIAFGLSEASLQNWLEGAVGQFFFILLIEGLVVLLLWWLLRIKQRTFKYIGLAWPTLRDLGLAIMGFGAYFLIYLIIATVAKALFPSINFEQEQQLGFETTQTSWQLILVFFSLVILPPLVEEILARGFLYTGLKTRWPKWIAVLVTSIMFAMAHLQFGSGAPLLWVAAIDTFTLSLVLIYLREKTGTLGAPIALHMLKNFIAFLLLFVFQVR